MGTAIDPPTIVSTSSGAPVLAQESPTNTTSAPQPAPLPAESAPTAAQEFPGAYPDEHDIDAPDTVNPNATPSAMLASAANTAKDALPSPQQARAAAQSAVESAREYLPDPELVRNATRGAIDMARQHLPERVAAYLPETTSTSAPASLPSTERAGAQPGERSDGVGALPGSASETSVALLPEERLANTPAEKKKFPSIKQASRGPQNAGAGHAPSGGIGTLSWAGSETSLAKLPDERNESRAGPSGPEHDESGTNGVAKETDDRSPKLPPQREQYPSTGADTGHSPSALNKELPPHPASVGSGAGGPYDAHVKPTFKERVKGEMKVIAGKLGGDEHIVEQGKRMMGKA